jgi:hypothetical protein
MSAVKMPTEMQAVSKSLSTQAQMLVDCVADLSHLLMFVTAMGERDGASSVQDRLPDAVGELVFTARILQFGLERLTFLSEAAAESDRMLFSKTMQMVDMCRFARAIPDHEPPPPPSTNQLADLVEDAVADLQEVLRARFPGETCPGD